MKHKIISTIIAIAFFVTLLLPINPIRLAEVTLIEIFIAAIYNLIYLNSTNSFYWAATRFFLLQLALLGLSFVLPAFLRPLLLLLCCIPLFAAELTIAAISEQLLLIETILTFFGICLFAFSASYYFLPSSTFILITLFILTVLICRVSFDFIPRSEYEKLFYSFLVALCVTEVSWALLLLPLHFSALAIISFNVLYIFWILSYYRLYNNVTGKKINFHLILSALLIIITLIFTPWK